MGLLFLLLFSFKTLLFLQWVLREGASQTGGIAKIGEQKKQTPLTEANTADGKKRLTTHTNLAPKPVDQEEIIRDVNYYQAQKVAQSMLDRGLISLDEFNKLTQINRDTFSPFLVEIMPEIR